jgi:hypothetical protein
VRKMLPLRGDPYLEIDAYTQYKDKSLSDVCRQRLRHSYVYYGAGIYPMRTCQRLSLPLPLVSLSQPCTVASLVLPSHQ